MWNEQIIMMLLEGIKDTLYMTLTSTLIGYVIGLPMGILLTVTDKDGIHPNTAVYKVLDVIANLIRSVPFLILLIVLIPFTRFLIGRSYGPTATIVPLVIAAAPYIARTSSERPDPKSPVSPTTSPLLTVKSNGRMLPFRPTCSASTTGIYCSSFL